MNKGVDITEEIQNAIHGHYVAEFPGTTYQILTQKTLRDLGKERYRKKFIILPSHGVRAIIYHGPEGLFWFGSDKIIKTLRLDGLPSPKTVNDRTIFDATWIPEERLFIACDAVRVRGSNLDDLLVNERIMKLAENWISKIRTTPNDDFKFGFQQFTEFDFSSYIFASMYSASSSSTVIPSSVSSSSTQHLDYLHLLSKSFLLCNDSKGYPGRSQSPWLLWWPSPSSVKVKFRIKYHQNIDGVFDFQIWSSTYGGIETMFKNLSHVSFTIPIRFPSDSIAECTYKRASDNSFRWCINKITLINYVPDHIRFALDVETSVSYPITIEQLRGAFSTPTSVLDKEEQVEWE